MICTLCHQPILYARERFEASERHVSPDGTERCIGTIAVDRQVPYCGCKAGGLRGVALEIARREQ